MHMHISANHVIIERLTMKACSILLKGLTIRERMKKWGEKRKGRRSGHLWVEWCAWWVEGLKCFNTAIQLTKSILLDKCQRISSESECVCACVFVCGGCFLYLIHHAPGPVSLPSFPVYCFCHSCYKQATVNHRGAFFINIYLTFDCEIIPGDIVGGLPWQTISKSCTESGAVYRPACCMSSVVADQILEFLTNQMLLWKCFSSKKKRQTKDSFTLIWGRA